MKKGGIEMKNKSIYHLKIGKTCKGIAKHPWDNLKQCKNCKNIPLLVGSDNLTFQSGKPYKIICRHCNVKTTSNEDLTKVINEWNKKISFYKLS